MDKLSVKMEIDFGPNVINLSFFHNYWQQNLKHGKGFIHVYLKTKWKGNLREITCLGKTVEVAIGWSSTVISLLLEIYLHALCSGDI